MGLRPRAIERCQSCPSTVWELPLTHEDGPRAEEGIPELMGMPTDSARLTAISGVSRRRTLGIFILGLVLCLPILHYFMVTPGIYYKGKVEQNEEWEGSTGSEDSGEQEWRIVNEGGETEYWKKDLFIDEEGNEHMNGTRYRPCP